MTSKILWSLANVCCHTTQLFSHLKYFSEFFIILPPLLLPIGAASLNHTPPNREDVFYSVLRLVWHLHDVVV